MPKDDEAIDGQQGQDVSSGIELEHADQGVDVDDRPRTPREEKLAALYQKYDEQEHGVNPHPEMQDYQEGMEAETGRPDLEPREGESDEEYDARMDAQDSKKPEAEPPVFQNDEGVWMTRMKVNGNTIERPYEEVMRTAQKHESADQRLEQLSQREKELKRFASDIDQQRQQIDRMQDKQQLSQKDADAMRQELMGQIREYQMQTFDGDDKAIETLANVIMGTIGRHSPTLDADTITEAAAERAEQRIEKRNQEKARNDSLDEGVNWLQENHSEILKDRVLYAALDRETELIEQESPDLAPAQVIRKATENVLSRFPGKDAKQTEQEQSVTNRDSRKRDLKPMPRRQAQTRPAPAPTEEVDNSPSAVIERTRQARAAIQNRS